MLLVLLAATACARVNGSGVKKTETRALEAFREVHLEGGLELKTEQGPPQISVSGDDNLVGLVQVELRDEVLRIAPKPNVSFSPTMPLTITVSTEKLHKLSARGGATIEVEGETDRQLELAVEGGGSLVANALDVDALQVTATGGAHLEIAGHAKHALLDLAGGVDAEAQGLEVNHAVLDASGGTNVSLTVTEAIAGHASGGSEATVDGNPPRRHLLASGGSDVTYLD